MYVLCFYFICFWMLCCRIQVVEFLRNDAFLQVNTSQCVRNAHSGVITSVAYSYDNQMLLTRGSELFLFLFIINIISFVLQWTTQ
jgi:hypothetical protein